MKDHVNPVVAKYMNSSVHHRDQPPRPCVEGVVKFAPGVTEDDANQLLQSFKDANAGKVELVLASLFDPADPNDI